MRRAVSILSFALALALWVFFLALESAVGSYVPPSERMEMGAPLPDYSEFAGPPTVTTDNCRSWHGEPGTGQGPVRIVDCDQFLGRVWR